MQVAQDLFDPRWKKICVRSASNGRRGKRRSDVVIRHRHGDGDKRWQAPSGSASLVLYEDSEKRVEDFEAAEWEKRGCVGAQSWSSASAKTIGCSSKYRGVSWNKGGKKWRVQITVDGKKKHIGYFADQTAAARAYDTFAIAEKLNKPLNFPGDAAAKGHVVTSSNSSLFRGVCWHKRDQKWEVKIRVDGKRKHIGYFVDEVEAVHA